MKYERKNGKYVFEKDGVYFELLPMELEPMRRAVNRAIREENKIRGIKPISANDQRRSSRAISKFS